jgi:hypothetical protein
MRHQENMRAEEMRKFVEKIAKRFCHLQNDMSLERGSWVGQKLDVASRSLGRLPSASISYLLHHMWNDTDRILGYIPWTERKKTR